jgi:hypothetical protein
MADVSPLVDAEGRLRDTAGASVRRLSGRGVATFPGRPGRPRGAIPRVPAKAAPALSAGVAVQRAAETGPKGPPIAGVPGDLSESWRSPRWLTVPRASAYSGLSPRRLWQAFASGELCPVRVPGSRRTLVDSVDLDAWMTVCKRRTAASDSVPEGR